MSASSDHIVCKEVYGSTGQSNVFVTSKERKTTELAKSGEPRSLRSLVTDTFKSAFLPQGYPDSVSEDYLNYQIWDSIQAFVSRLMGTLSTREVLKGMGVGDESVTVLAATITWIMRDGCSMLARIIFAWYESTGLDYNSKQWRLFADVMNDVAIFFDLMASHFRMLNKPMLCVAGIFRATVDAAGGATRAAFVQHQARRGNLADVAAKDGSQETLVNLAGLIISLIVLPLVETNATLYTPTSTNQTKPNLLDPPLIRSLITWLLFILLTSLHLFANYKAVKTVALRSLNQLRMSILVTHFMEAPSCMLTVEEVNFAEPVVLGSVFSWDKIYLGCSFQKALKGIEDSIDPYYELFKTSHYFLVANSRTRKIFVVLEKGCDAITEIKASFHAHVLLYYFRNVEKPTIQNILRPYTNKGVMDQLSLLRWSKEHVDDNFPAFLKKLEDSGWDTDRTLLGSDEWRAEWKKKDD